jgi:hypothetical protein
MHYRKLGAMTQSVLMTIVFALLVYGVERNHLRQARRRLPRRHEMIGSTDIEDRDQARLLADLWALPPATDPTGPSASADRRRPTVPRPRSAPRATLPVQH